MRLLFWEELAMPVFPEPQAAGEDFHPGNPTGGWPGGGWVRSPGSPRSGGASRRADPGRDGPWWHRYCLLAQIPATNFSILVRYLKSVRTLPSRLPASKLPLHCNSARFPCFLINRVMSCLAAHCCWDFSFTQGSPVGHGGPGPKSLLWVGERRTGRNVAPAYQDLHPYRWTPCLTPR